MAEQRLIDGKRLYRKLIELHKSYGSCDFEHRERRIENKREIDTILRCMDYVKSAPTIEAVVPVRCKDCKWLVVHNWEHLYAHCGRTGIKFLPSGLDTRKHYCSYGEKKESEVK